MSGSWKWLTILYSMCKLGKKPPPSPPPPLRDSGLNWNFTAGDRAWGLLVHLFNLHLESLHNHKTNNTKNSKQVSPFIFGSKSFYLKTKYSLFYVRLEQLQAIFAAFLIFIENSAIRKRF
jgi:hypothetical protein